jgi:hypothetical protein
MSCQRAQPRRPRQNRLHAFPRPARSERRRRVRRAFRRDRRSQRRRRTPLARMHRACGRRSLPALVGAAAAAARMPSTGRRAASALGFTSPRCSPATAATTARSRHSTATPLPCGLDRTRTRAHIAACARAQPQAQACTHALGCASGTRLKQRPSSGRSFALADETADANARGGGRGCVCGPRVLWRSLLAAHFAMACITKMSLACCLGRRRARVRGGSAANRCGGGKTRPPRR